MTPRQDTEGGRDPLSAPLQLLHRTRRGWRVGGLAAVAGLALAR